MMAMKPLRIISPIHKANRQFQLYLEGRARARGRAGFIGGHLLVYLLSYQPASVGGLCRMTGLKPSTMTSVLDRMEKRDLIDRRPNPDDRRSWLVDLTDEGTKLAKRMRAMVEKFERDVIAELEESDLEGFRRVFEAIDKVTSVKVREEN